MSDLHNPYSMKPKHRILIAIGAIVLILLLLLWTTVAEARPLRSLSAADSVTPQPQLKTIRYSTAGFHVLEGSGRTVRNMDPAWRFAQGHHEGAWQEAYPADSGWQAVSLPHGLELLPVDASGGVNYRGEAWYRKYFATPANIEGKGEISIRDLVKNALRMRPDRIVIGECRGGEALDMLQAMNTGHDGSLTTIHANSPRDALSRLETLVLMAGFDLPLRAIREQIASAIAIIVQISREKDGSRKVTHVSEITKMEGEIITMQDIFVFKQDGWDKDGKMTGRYVPTGSIPTFMDDIRRAGMDLDISMFNKGAGNGGFR